MAAAIRAERSAVRARVPGLLLAAVGGAAAALAQPPFGLLPGLLGFALILHALDRARPGRLARSAFAQGWAAGTAYFAISTWWVGEAFLVDIAVHGWQAPFVIVLLAGGLGLLWGAAGLAYRLLAPVGRLGAGAARRVLVFAAVWAVWEWVRGHLLTGFPWDLPGEAWRAGSAPSQAAALLGAYGLSVVTLAIAAAPAVLLGSTGRVGRSVAIGSALVALAALYIGGGIRLGGATAADTALRLRVVQANVPQAAKWDAAAFADIIGRYTRLTAQTPAGATPPPDVVIWPEAAIPADVADYLAPGSWTRRAVLDALRPGELLMAGVQRHDAGAPPRYFNSLLVLRREAAADGLTTLASYDKHHLVPFGEYLPWRPLMTAIGFNALAHIPDDFTPGPPPRPVTPAGLPPVQPLICYETLFPGYVERSGPRRPRWIVNVSNDAWFGQTSGPWQHLNIASYRAIEEGLPIVRATPTGVSAVIDAYGRARALLGTGREGVIDAALPPALAPTPFSRWRNWPFWTLVLAGLACCRLPRRSSENDSQLTQTQA